MPPLPAQTNECTSCSSRTSPILHNVRHRGAYRRLCSSCVLRLHPASFCPSCFQLHDPTPPHPHKRVNCSNCNSITHSQCIPNHPVSAPYLCPPCGSPAFVFFSGDKQGGTVNKVVDKASAAVLLCAARIAAVSMGKAVAFARVEAERKVREAAVAGKRAKEALEHVADLRRRKKEEGEQPGTRGMPGTGPVKMENGGGGGSAVKVESIDNGNGSVVVGGGSVGGDAKIGN